MYYRVWCPRRFASQKRSSGGVTYGYGATMVPGDFHTMQLWRNKVSVPASVMWIMTATLIFGSAARAQTFILKMMGRGISFLKMTARENLKRSGS